MFRNLANQFANAGVPEDRIFLVHPLQLSRWLEEAWVASAQRPAIGGITGDIPELGSAIADFDLPIALRTSAFQPGIDPADPGSFKSDAAVTATTIWDHLIYAYLLESTGVFEIMAEVVRRLVVGETLEPVSSAARQWVRATEELFFRDPPLFSVVGVSSQLRPDARVARRNAYWRMFGMDLPHPVPAAWVSPAAPAEAPWKLDTGAGVNSAFREKWSELLRQLWLGIENSRNLVGANATDAEYIALLCLALDDMLGNRRRNGALAREEFAYVTMLSWFHLTLATDTPIVVDLQATASSPEERLVRIGQRVGVAPATRSRELFQLADRMSALLWAIEFGLFNTGIAARVLFDSNAGNPALVTDVNNVIDLWQSATGERVKDVRVSVQTPLNLAPSQPLRIPTTTAPGITTPVLSSNGDRR